MLTRSVKRCAQHVLCMLSFHLLLPKTTKTWYHYDNRHTKREQQSWDLSSHLISLGLSFSICIRRLGLMNSKLHFGSNIPTLPLHCEVLFTQAQILSKGPTQSLPHWIAGLHWYLSPLCPSLLEFVKIGPILINTTHFLQLLNTVRD